MTGCYRNHHKAIFKYCSDEYPNKIKEKEIKRFAPAKLSGCEYEYRHYDDCKASGCKGHKARFKYCSASGIFTLDFGDGTIIYIDETQINLIDDYIKRLKE